MYKVIHFFTDLHDNDHPYNVGDIFPREGIRVTAERLRKLAGSDNRQGIPLIALEEEPEEVDAALASGNDAEPVSQKKVSAVKSRTKKTPAKKTATKTVAETSGK